MRREELPVPTATSLGLEGFSNLDRNHLLSLILSGVEGDFTHWDAGNSLVARYQELSASIGRDVRIELPGGREIQSKARSVDELGRLHLEDGHIVSVGDVIHLR
jgi:BirA family biotin operon repressor/biotin-[acetyl-CoA-carboxylase] ligase